jgi:hypothetical protein
VKPDLPLSASMDPDIYFHFGLQEDQRAAIEKRMKQE